MGILTRFTDIMKSNINALLDKCEDPAKMIDQTLRDLREDLAEVKKETAMWKGSKTIQDVIQRSRTLFWTFFYKLLYQRCEEATSCCAVSTLVCGS